MSLRRQLLNLIETKKVDPYTRRHTIPEGLWTKCPECQETLFQQSLYHNFNVCQYCDYHFSLPSLRRISSLLDKGTFKQIDEKMSSVDILDFKGVKPYKQKLEEDIKKTKLYDAVLCGSGCIENIRVAICVMDPRFIMGSLGSVVGEKITRTIEMSLSEKLPLLIFSASGGARMQEGVFSLMQMAKTSAALAHYNQSSHSFYISVLTHPTLGGVSASYAFLGDIILSEPNTLIGFAGPRVIEQTIKQKLPEGFQKSDFLLKKGMIDQIVHRKEMRNEILRLLKLMQFTPEP